MKIRIFKLFVIDCSDKEWLSKHLTCNDFGTIRFSLFEITHANICSGLVNDYSIRIGYRVNQGGEMKTVWVVGQLLDGEKNKWQLQGVFDTKKKAVNACKNFSYFVGKVILNKEYPEQTTVWTGAYYPLAEGE